MCIRDRFWIGGLGVYPALLQRFRVTPNELVAERPYIQHNIRMTRQAYGLDQVQEKDFPADESLTPAALDRNALTIKNVRLWDHRPLLTTYGQLQEIRTLSLIHISEPTRLLSISYA